jgi:site-specific recombinase XerD
VAKIVKARMGKHLDAIAAPDDIAKVDAARFSGHSLRVGFAVTAAEHGADLQAIASVTRHRSMLCRRDTRKKLSSCVNRQIVCLA